MSSITTTTISAAAAQLPVTPTAPTQSAPRDGDLKQQSPSQVAGVSRIAAEREAKHTDQSPKNRAPDNVRKKTESNFAGHNDEKPSESELKAKPKKRKDGALDLRA